jgi:hypothetical protein
MCFGISFSLIVYHAAATIFATSSVGNSWVRYGPSPSDRNPSLFWGPTHGKLAPAYRGLHPRLNRGPTPPLGPSGLPACHRPRRRARPRIRRRLRQPRHRRATHPTPPLWAVAYLWLGGHTWRSEAILYSIDSMSTRGSSGVAVQKGWRVMAALGAAGPHAVARHEHRLHLRGDADLLADSAILVQPNRAE